MLSTERGGFIVEHSLCSFGIGRGGGRSLSHTALRFHAHFHKNPPSRPTAAIVSDEH